MVLQYSHHLSVAPLVGAWIEIVCWMKVTALFTSLPSWERGLKLAKVAKNKFAPESLPSWERGLKF